MSSYLYGRRRGQEEQRNDINQNVVDIIKSDDLTAFLNVKDLGVMLKSTNLSHPFPLSGVVSDKGISLIHVAAYYDALEIFMYLVEVLDKKIDMATADNYQPLHYACAGNAVEVAVYILNEMPILAKLNTQTEHQFIYCAALGDSPDILRLLVENGADPSSPENRKNDPFKFVIAQKKMQSLIVLLQNFKPSLKGSSRTPIIWAIINSLYEAIPFLIESGCDPAEITTEKMTALSCLCFCGCQKLEVYRLLCQHCAKNIDLPTSIVAPAAVHWICQTSNPQIVRMVCQCSIDVNRADHDGKFGPDYLKEDKVDEAIQILEILVEYGFDINNSHPDGVPLIATFLGWISPSAKIVAWFINHGADIDIIAFNRNGEKNTVRDVLLRRMGASLDELGVVLPPKPEPV